MNRRAFVRGASAIGLGGLAAALIRKANAGDTVQEYRIKRAIGGSGTYLLRQVCPGNVTSYIDDTVVAGTQYYYKIAAVNCGHRKPCSTRCSIR